MWLTIVLSFGFYIPVVLWADVYPIVGNAYDTKNLCICLDYMDWIQ